MNHGRIAGADAGDYVLEVHLLPDGEGDDQVVYVADDPCLQLLEVVVLFGVHYSADVIFAEVNLTVVGRFGIDGVAGVEVDQLGHYGRGAQVDGHGEVPAAAITGFYLDNLGGAAASAQRGGDFVVGSHQFGREILQDAKTRLEDGRVDLLADGNIEPLVVGGMIADTGRGHLEVELAGERVEFEAGIFGAALEVAEDYRIAVGEYLPCFETVALGDCYRNVGQYGRLACEDDVLAKFFGRQQCGGPGAVLALIDDDLALAAISVAAADAAEVDADLLARFEQCGAGGHFGLQTAGLELHNTIACLAPGHYFQTSCRYLGSMEHSRGPTIISQPVASSSLPLITAT